MVGGKPARPGGGSSRPRLTPSSPVTSSWWRRCCSNGCTCWCSSNTAPEECTWADHHHPAADATDERHLRTRHRNPPPELLDRVLILGERHLVLTLGEYVIHDNRHGPHQSRQQRPPDIETQSVKILRYQFDKGYASRLDLAAQESQLAQTQASLPPLRKQLEQQRHLIAVLAGEFPAQARAADFDLASWKLPQDLPLSLPSRLVEQRPDVRQAQANWHASSAQVGVAIASRLPQITLSANAGSTALQIADVFKSGTGFWSVGLDLAAPIFQGGKLLHAERGAKAQLVQAAAQYRSTVLTAFQNVADTLTALDEDAKALQAAAAAADAAEVTLDLAQRQVQSGYANELSLLNAQQAWQQARIALIQAQANRYADTAALYLALGGGWWHDADLSGSNHED